MIVGAAGAVGRKILNPVSSDAYSTRRWGRAWLRHNIEEVGLFEHFLPGLYKTQA